jgi:flagellar biosynthetic protein FliR
MNAPLSAELLPDAALAAGVFMRMATAVAAGAMPLASRVGIRVRVAVAMVLAVAALPAARGTGDTLTRLPAWPFMLAGEAVVGLAMGAAAACVLAAAGWAGMILGSVAGLSWADDFTPDAEGDPQGAGMASFAAWLALAGFLAVGGHLHVVAGLIDSVRTMPVGTALNAGAAPVEAIVCTLPGLALSLALALAAPALAAVVTFHLATAICLRAIRFSPGPGVLQAVASLVLFAAVVAGAATWIGGFAAGVHAPLERCFSGLAS